ncbi:phosphoglycolate phosphatase-like HAD superfamily hydrolase [Bradyrhizobium japonicum]|nr:phosphoglycolate phosphatase [Bradyrhizobium japonicum]MCP1859888.1 phosphoglycolate phosphatase [Bradyrhizobium japonicum]MCP1890654.1 phosphoglycolate phosphatase [Bradyrhizobium japonicum]MCW2323686.1 phosphoglycolate phosphatase [Bradyrhizobium japonicum]
MATIFFDLDGTLTNPKPGITRSIQYALERLDLTVPSEDELTWCIGPPLHASLKKLTGSDELADRALLLYRERFADIGLFENEAYAGIIDTLTMIAATSQRMFVATSKPAVYATRIVDQNRISSACSAPSSTARVSTSANCCAMRSTKRRSIPAARS